MTDPHTRSARLLSARDAAMVLGRLRPDLQHIAADLAKNAELQLKWPDDPDFKAAGARLVRELERRTCQ